MQYIIDSVILTRPPCARFIMSLKSFMKASLSPCSAHIIHVDFAFANPVGVMVGFHLSCDPEGQCVPQGRRMFALECLLCLVGMGGGELIKDPWLNLMHHTMSDYCSLWGVFGLHFVSHKIRFYYLMYQKWSLWWWLWWRQQPIIRHIWQRHISLIGNILYTTLLSDLPNWPQRIECHVISICWLNPSVRQ